MNKPTPIRRHRTGIPGFDLISDGGLPEGRTTLVSGTAGSSKTVLAVQFLAMGILECNENGVMVTFEESPLDICRNVLGFGWDLFQWESEGKLAFVDASPQPGEPNVIAGAFDFGALLSRIEHAIKKVGAKRISMDSIGAVFSQFTESGIVRTELFRIATALKQIGTTALLTAERTEEYGEISRFGVEEFVADNVIILRNSMEEEKRRRTIEILKFRGTCHQKGEFPFTVLPEMGLVVMPLSAMELKQKSSNLRISSGNIELDRMCRGGFFKNSVILVSGATGNGKTLMVAEFVKGADQAGEKCLLFAYEESREQLFRNADGWGVDFERMEKAGNLKLVCMYPEAMGLEDHLIRIKQIVDEFKPDRVAVDSLSALERVSARKGFREFVIGVTSFIKQRETAGLFTSTTPSLMGGSSITEAHISTITDSIIMLRYVEVFGEVRRAMTVLKMRGSMHDREIREFTIDHEGMHIGKTFRNITGILSGRGTNEAPEELDRIGGLFQEPG